MRLQLIAAATLAAAAAAALPAAHAAAADADADAADVLTGRVQVYADDDATTVVTQIADLQVALGDGAHVGGHVLVDVVSTASVDVVSAATTRWAEGRTEAGAEGGATLGGVELSLGARTSQEEDWRSWGLGLELTRDLAEKNTRLSAAYALVDNAVGRAADPSFERSLVVHTVELGVVQLLGPRTFASATYTLQLADGFQSSPYRVVILGDDSAVPERHPDGRARHALAVRIVRAAGQASAWDLGYRVYADDWGMTAHTVTTALRTPLGLGDTWELRLRARGHVQTAADFYAERYDAPQRYVSADRELSTNFSVAAGARLAWQRGGLVVDAGADVTRWQFFDFARLGDRLAVVTALGVRWSW